MTGTATPALFWVAMEQRGPWGKRAFVESHLDPSLGAAFEKVCKDAGGKALLIRGIDGHTDSPGPRRVLIAGGDGERPWLLSGLIQDPTDIVALPFESLTGPCPDLPGFEPADPVVLVCTNGKRDQCCSVLSRPVVNGLYLHAPGQVWECTHLAGHRFAPTALVLPTRQVLGRVNIELALHALELAGQGELLLDVDHDRGRTHLSPMLQATDTFVRNELHLGELAAVRLEQINDSEVRAQAGTTTLRLQLAQRPLPPNPASCGIEPKIRQSWGVLVCEGAE